MISCSIIVAIYNKAEYLDNFFKCLLLQNIDNKEIIFIDDCSADDSCKKCLVFAEIDKEAVEDKGQYLLSV